MFITSFLHSSKSFWLFWGSAKVIFVKFSQNFIKSPLKFAVSRRFSVHSLWHICFIFVLPLLLFDVVFAVGSLPASVLGLALQHYKSGPKGHFTIPLLFHQTPPPTLFKKAWLCRRYLSENGKQKWLHASFCPGGRFVLLFLPHVSTALLPSLLPAELQ